MLIPRYTKQRVSRSTAFYCLPSFSCGIGMDGNGRIIHVTCNRVLVSGLSVAFLLRSLWCGECVMLLEYSVLLLALLCLFLFL